MTEKLQSYLKPQFLLAIFLFAAIPLGLYIVGQPTRTESEASGGVMEDTNRDGKVSLDDAAHIRTLMEKNQYEKSADLNNDNKIDAKDVEAFYDIYSVSH